MRRRRKPGRPGRGALSFLALLLATSATLRIVDGAGQAIAEASTEEMREEDTGDRGSFATAARAVFDPEGIAELLSELKMREAELARREELLTERQAELDAAEAILTENLEALTAAEQQLEATLALADGAMEQDIARLTRVYETMKPKEAAALFEQMDPTFAAGFLARMDPKAAAGVLAGLSPEAAYGISVLFAARHGDVPQN